MRLNERNPRAHSPRQIRQIARSIETFGFNVPVLVDAQNQVIAGHGRVLACQQLGWTEVPTIRLNHLGPDQARAFMIADNRLAETSAWNERLLAETLRDLSLAELDFSLEAIGFEMGEIDLRIESLDTPPLAKDDLADAPVPLPTGLAVSQPGDLWLLGRHRLLCGNALDEAAHTQLMAGKRAAMVFTDPPYNVPIAGHVSGLGAIQHREFAMASGEMSAAEFTAFLRSSLGPPRLRSLAMPRKPRQKVSDYTVGYGKPPEHSRFRPGRSGNARGRPKGSANLRTLIERALAEKVPVKEGGRRRMISKGEAVAKQVVNKAAGADLGAARLLLSLLTQHGCEDGGEAPDRTSREPDAYRHPAAPNYDNMTTKELETLYAAALILEGKKERPPVPVPPSGPKRREEE